MTTKVTDKGITFPDGSKQTTAAFGSSGDIVANYTNKWANSVARDPQDGNLYLAYGINISTKYDEVTKIYISDTDGDGEVRNFDQVKEDDKITITSDNGSGKYTIVTISDMNGYRELIVSTESSNGTIANDTAVSLALDVASSGESSGIEEAPADGKQYARQDETWTEVTGSTPTPEALVWENKTADREINTVYTNTNDVPLYLQVYISADAPSQNNQMWIDGAYFGAIGQSGSNHKHYDTSLFIVPSGATYELRAGTNPAEIEKWREARMPLAIAVGEASSGVTAQPPVAFRLHNPNVDATSGSEMIVPFSGAHVDTDNGFNVAKKCYVVQKAGIYDVSASIVVDSGKNVNLISSTMKVLINNVGQGTSYESQKDNEGRAYTTTEHLIVNLEIGDEIQVNVTASSKDGSDLQLKWCSLNGHMVSSITEGSGGGDYTPEKMVWEDKLADRVGDVEYTNDNDVPIYVNIATKCADSDTASYSNFSIDGENFGVVGAEATVEGRIWNQNFHTVPAGSTYKLTLTGDTLPTITSWKEARMPVAVGTGDSIWTEEDGEGCL